MRTRLSRRRFLTISLAAVATEARAAPRTYDLLTDRSRVTFSFVTSGVRQTGTVPLTRADIRVDVADLAASSADVVADVRKVRTGFIFITRALLSPDVLDAQNHPEVRFRSTRIALGARGRISEGARITGDLTLRGITRSVSFDAVLSRPPGSAPDDLSLLYVDLKGALSRAAFGATSYTDLVEDTVNLDIHAEIRARA